MLMRTGIGEIYHRGFRLIAALPLLVAVPILAEFVQHAAEIRLGMYAGGMDDACRAVRLAFGAAKILAIFVTMLVAWRWWRFEGDLARALRPTAAMLRGLGLLLLMQLAGDGAALALGRGAIALVGEPEVPIRIALTALPLLGWLFLSGALFPWYVALVTEDRTMTLAASWRASRGRLWATWGTLLAGTMPLMAVHYALGYAAIAGKGPAWLLMAMDAGVVGSLSAMLAATYFTIYARAHGRLMSR